MAEGTVKEAVRDSLGGEEDTGLTERVSREVGRAARAGLEWDGTEVLWVGYEAVEEGVEKRGRYTADDQDCRSPNELS
jgi:hypothetical protein